MIDLNLIRKQIKVVREEKFIAAETMAQALNIDTSNYHKIENGKRKKLDLVELDIISDALGISLIALINHGKSMRKKDSGELKQQFSLLLQKYTDEIHCLSLTQGANIEIAVVEQVSNNRCSEHH